MSTVYWRLNPITRWCSHRLHQDRCANGSGDMNSRGRMIGGGQTPDMSAFLTTALRSDIVPMEQHTHRAACQWVRGGVVVMAQLLLNGHVATWATRTAATHMPLLHAPSYPGAKPQAVCHTASPYRASYLSFAARRPERFDFLKNVNQRTSVHFKMILEN